MTREHILVLGLDEIIGVRLQCDSCKGAISFRLNETINLQQSCPSCGAAFVDAASFNEFQAMAKFVAAAKEIGSHKRMKATLKLEVNADQ